MSLRVALFSVIFSVLLPVVLAGFQGGTWLSSIGRLTGPVAVAADLSQARVLRGLDLGASTKAERSVDLSTATSVVVFLSARCPCSASHEKLLAQLSARYPQLQFVGVHSNADENDARDAKHFLDATLPFPVLQDTNAKWANAFGALKTPHAFVLNAAGEILYQGGVTNSHDALRADRQFLADALAAVTAGKTPETREGRSLGCVIARSK